MRSSRSPTPTFCSSRFRSKRFLGTCGGRGRKEELPRLSDREWSAAARICLLLRPVNASHGLGTSRRKRFQAHKRRCSALILYYTLTHFTVKVADSFSVKIRSEIPKYEIGKIQFLEELILKFVFRPTWSPEGRGSVDLLLLQ